MTETYAGSIGPEDIEDAADTVSARLDRQADAILSEAEARAFEPAPLREAVRKDAARARDWGRARAARLRGAVETRPVRASLYALGLGVVIGLLIAR